ncbi:YabP/YqfC family sporulation protein [Marasmitruncus massiliensis]|uniref:YabP/YqfC family sporulation protein n=1 Tax=Marasmitruncus massiliensis TaxID=1944642 RepID=UPI000C7D9DEB|nr:YabP/YqfC family sporulation protein [Marasmitruncus massiliensis]
MRKKRKVQERKISVPGLIARSLELPVDVLEGLPEIELLGNQEAVIEHCQSVLEYNDQVVRIRAGRLTLKFTGRGLRLRTMTGDSIVVEGFFTSVEFAG